MPPTGGDRGAPSTLHRDKSPVGNTADTEAVVTSYQGRRGESPRMPRHDVVAAARTNAKDSAEGAAGNVARACFVTWSVSKSLSQTRRSACWVRTRRSGAMRCSRPFLALVLRQDLQARLEERGHEFEWADVIEDLDRLQVVEVDQDGKRFLLRSEAQGTCGPVFQAVGVALPPTVRQVSPITQGGDTAHSATPPG